MHRFIIHFCVLLTFWRPLAWADLSDGSVLARVELAGPVEAFQLPVHAFLQDSDGREYLLVVATGDRLKAVGWPYEILDPFDRLSSYAVAREQKPGARAQAGLQVLHDDGRNLVVRLQPGDWETLSGQGLILAPLSAVPLVWAPPGLQGKERALLAAEAYSPMVAAMIGRIRATNLFQQVAQLSGVQAAVADGRYTNILTRKTTSGTPIQRATQYAYDRFSALGFTTIFHPWTNGGYSGRNVVATQTGVSSPAEIVLMVAHIDSYASGSIAPGADDNASGSAAVLESAGLLARHRFERTVRLVLFTGEEQGLLGSDRYAAAAAAAGDQIVGVINLDMIAWSSLPTPALRIHTRTSGNPGYAADLQLYSTFTNVAALYGLAAGVQSILTADGETASDHSCFWSRGYSAILAIEDDYSNFNPYYHSTSDLLSNLNLDYFTRFTQISLGTVAHLARVVEAAAMDAVEIVNADPQPGSTMSLSRFVARHLDGATETGADPYDGVWTNSPAPFMGNGLKIISVPYDIDLNIDARPLGSETIFHGVLSAVSTGSTPLACANRLRFGFVGPSETSRVYTAKVQIHATYADDSNAFLCVTNVRALAAGGGWMSLPNLARLTNGAVYGTVELLTGTVSQNPSNFPAAIRQGTNGAPVFEASAQAGCRVVDTVLASTNLLDAAGWSVFQRVTNDVPPQAANFESGWVTLSYPALPGSNMECYLRFERSWIAFPAD
ncbi:MAG: hypothetical protein A2X46_09175 [Lentisphaerae bacterium GWF2_57_35]|nr:MAG: hypothetical protein A2X46_09175 [Lentisphaerae bacterium GWF2_57_35]